MQQLVAQSDRANLCLSSKAYTKIAKTSVLFQASAHILDAKRQR